LLNRFQQFRLYYWPVNFALLGIPFLFSVQEISRGVNSLGHFARIKDFKRQAHCVN